MALQTTMSDIKNGRNFYFMAKLKIECAHSYDVQMWVQIIYSWLAPGFRQLQKRSTLAEESQLGRMSSSERLASGLSKILCIHADREATTKKSFLLPSPSPCPNLSSKVGDTAFP